MSASAALHEAARRLAAAGLAAVDPAALVSRELASRREPFSAVLALGKAAAAMARGAARPVIGLGARRLLIRPHSSPALRDPAWEEISGGHPLPDEGSLAAGARLRRWLSELSDSDRLLALVSGGASACLELPARGLTLPDMVAVQRALQRSGLSIDAVNAVRKHLSQLKGGGALRASRGRVIALLLSDVPGDDPAVVASGPFAADPTTFGEALAAIRRLPAPAMPRTGPGPPRGGRGAAWDPGDFEARRARPRAGRDGPPRRREDGAASGRRRRRGASASPPGKGISPGRRPAPARTWSPAAAPCRASGWPCSWGARPR